MVSPLSAVRKLGPAAWRSVPWIRVWTVALWLGAKGRDRLNENLTAPERKELGTLLARSKGRPGNLTQRDRTRVRNIVRKAAFGEE